MGQEGQHPRHHIAGGRRRLRRRQHHDAALPLRIAAAAGSARKRVPARRGRQEQQRPHHHRSRSGHQPDPARAVARSGARSDQERKSRRAAGIRSGAARPVGAQNCPQPVRHRPRSGRHDERRAHARILLRPAQRLRGGKVARHRHRFRFRQSGTRRPRRQRDRRDLSHHAADEPAGSNPRRRRLAGRRNRRPAHQSGGRRGQGRRLSRQGQSVCRLQQYLAADPAAHRDQFADFGGARAEGRPGGEGAPIARARPLRQAD